MSASPAAVAMALTETLLTHGHEPTNVTGFFGPGTVLIFMIILVPVYVMLAGWFLGSPRDLKSALLGCTIFFGLITAMWVGMFFAMELIGILFY